MTQVSPSGPVLDVQVTMHMLCGAQRLLVGQSRVPAASQPTLPSVAQEDPLASKRLHGVRGC
eukprot:COSAG01_NODE_67287_length_267_cov_1.166667_1_plen_61_part_01